jgi:adenosylcobinamide kinase / adenosylcobinamide-phosphate guanylyltransferase
MSERLILVLGGTRSGKSRYGLQWAREMAGDGPVHYLATAHRGDPELEERISGHQRARPPDWPTVEVGADLAGAIGSVPAEATILVDGLTLWVSTLTGDDDFLVDALLDGPVASSLEAIAAHAGAVVVVSDEIGLGMVPMDPLARRFRDLLGLVHQRYAATADEVYLMVAGLPMRLKGG